MFEIIIFVLIMFVTFFNTNILFLYFYNYTPPVWNVTNLIETVPTVHIYYVSFL